MLAELQETEMMQISVPQNCDIAMVTEHNFSVFLQML